MICITLEFWAFHICILFEKIDVVVHVTVRMNASKRSIFMQNVLILNYLFLFCISPPGARRKWNAVIFLFATIVNELTYRVPWKLVVYSTLSGPFLVPSQLAQISVVNSQKQHNTITRTYSFPVQLNFCFLSRFSLFLFLSCCPTANIYCHLNEKWCTNQWVRWTPFDNCVAEIVVRLTGKSWRYIKLL